MSNADIRGRFVWHELMTTDTKAAGAFYPKVTNWKTQAWEKDPSYTMWAVAKGPFGGLRPLPDAARTVGPHWLPYIGTPDVDATVNSAQALGARVTMGATDISDVGRFAVLADPQGAQFAIYSSPSAGGGSMPQAFSWHELSTSDPVEALRFYGALFGWSEVATHDMGPIGLYHLVGLGGVASIGMWKSSAESSSSPHWLCYAHVADVDKSSNAVKTAGGKLLRGPMEVPGGTWIAQATDPQGASFALHADKRIAAATPQPPKASAPTSVSAGAPSKPQPSRSAAASGRSQTLRSVSAPKPAAVSTAKSAAAKKAPAKKPAAKKASVRRGAARKSAAKKSRAKRSSARRRPQSKAKRIAKRGMKSAAVKRRSAKRKSSRRRTAPGRLEVARRFAAKQADSILKRLRGKKRR